MRKSDSSDGMIMIMDVVMYVYVFFFFSSRRRHTRFDCDWSSDVCSSDLGVVEGVRRPRCEIPPGEPRPVAAHQLDALTVRDPQSTRIRHRGAWGGKRERSEERRVGKECRSRWSPYH